MLPPMTRCRETRSSAAWAIRPEVRFDDADRSVFDAGTGRSFWAVSIESVRAF